MALLALFMAGSSQAQMADCSAVRTGRFECTHKSGTSIIERNEQEQFEREVGGSWEMRLRVEWIGPCTYRLHALKPPADDKQMDGAGVVPECRIEDVNELGFSVRTTWEGGPAEGVLLHYKRLR